jgi:DNA ligase-4
MPFPFTYVCSLLDDLERLHIRENPLLPRELLERSTSKTNQWLKAHKFDLNAFDTQEAAVLWVLRPDKLTDRHYGIDTNRLESIIARAYQVSQLDYTVLQSWRRVPHLGDLAQRVESVRAVMPVSCHVCPLLLLSMLTAI